MPARSSIFSPCIKQSLNHRMAKEPSKFFLDDPSVISWDTVAVSQRRPGDRLNSSSTISFSSDWMVSVYPKAQLNREIVCFVVILTSVAESPAFILAPFLV